MPSFSDILPFMPWIAGISAIVGAALLIVSIRKLLKMLKAAELVKLPLREEQDLDFAMAGPVILCIEGPLMSRRFANLGFTLQTEYGTVVPGRKNWYRARSSGFSTARIQLQTYQLPHPGRYRLRIESLGAEQPRDAEHAIVFAKPHVMATFAYILGILLASWLLIGGVVLFALTIVSR